MPKHYTSEFKEHYIDVWRTNCLTRRQYAESKGINEGAFKHWPSQIKSKDTPSAGLSSILSVQIARPSTPEALTEPVMAYLPGGCRTLLRQA